jgi:hypothetical protein
VSTSSSYRTKWKWVALPATAMLLLSLLPQVNLWLVRGRNWNGAYVSPQGDEFVYSAYINALMDGRTRKNDPFAGKDSTLKSPLPESTFSIQFIPAYAIAFSARTFHASASTAFIALIGVAGFLAILSVFWLLNAVLDDHRLATAGTFFVLCLGGIAAGSGILGVLLKSDLASPILPFLRRYQPAAAFPLFFVFNTLVWRSLTSPAKWRARISTGFAGLTLAVLIFSYLYLWTAAAAWLVCISVLWLYFRPGDRRRTSAVLAGIGIATSVALVPYIYLVSHRAPSLDEEQALISTHQLDLFRVPEILGMFVVIALCIGVWRGRIQASQSTAIYAASLALFPFVIFNQQVLTGRSMQPHHFAHFVANYAVLLAMVLCVTLLWKTISPRVLVWIAALSFSWALVEVGLVARLASVPSAISNDQMIPLLLRLKELSNQDGTVAGLRNDGRAPALVFSPNIGVTALLPTWTSQGTLLDMRGLDFGSLTPEERRKFFYMHLYYSRVPAESLRNALKDTSNDVEMNYYARSVIFSYERVLRGLSYQFHPIQPEEIEREVRAYEDYTNSFSREQALKRPITYAVIPAEANFDFTNLDRWYERDAGERVGDYALYRLKLRN